MKIELKNVRGTRGMEGAGYTATLWIEERYVADVADWGDGGPTNFYPPKGKSRVPESMRASVIGRADVEEALKPARDFVAQIRATPEQIAAWPDWQKELYPDGHEYAGTEGLEAYLAGIVDRMEDERRLRRLCKGRLVVLLKDGKTVYWKVADTPEARAKIAAKHQVAEWINDRFKESA